MKAVPRATLAVEELDVYVDGLDHPEGVTVDAHGVVWAGGEAGQIYRVERGSFEEVAGTGGFLLGLCADQAGRLYCCDIRRREVVRVDPRTGSVDVYSAGTRERPMVNPNWPVFDAAGNLYVTDSGGWKTDDGCIWRIDPSGRAEVWTEATKRFPNGACLTAQGDALLVLESLAPALVRVPINDDGSAGRPRLVAHLSDLVPDGVTLADDGVAYVCCYRPDRIVAVHPDGSVDLVADDPEGTVLSAPTNAVWIGADHDELIVGNLGRWHLTHLRPGRRGVPLVHPQLP